MAFKTATSVVRSRMAMAMALPATKIKRDDDGRADPVNRVLEVAQHLAEHLAEGFLGLGPRGIFAVAVQLVDPLAHSAPSQPASLHLM